MTGFFLPLLAASVVSYSAALTDKSSDVFVLCTGSDWVSHAEEFRAMFEQSAKTYEGKTLWAVYDRRDGISDEESKSLGQLPVDIYGYPAVIFRDPEGHPLWQRESLKLGDLADCRDMVKRWEKLRQERDVKLKAARAMPKGVARAKVLGEALAIVLDPVINTFSERVVGHYFYTYRQLVDEIKESDPDDTLGYVRKYTFCYMPIMEGTINKNVANKAFEENEKFIKELLANPVLLPIQRQYVWLMAFRNRKEQGEALWPKAFEALDRCITEDPKSTLATSARDAKRYYSEPIKLSGLRWECRDNRPYWATAIVDVTKQIQGSGTYSVKFVTKQGQTSFRNCLLYCLDRQLAADNRAAQEFKLKVSGKLPSTIMMKVELHGHGWFDGRGEIVIEKLKE